MADLTVTNPKDAQTIWSGYQSATSKDQYRSTLSEAEQKIFDELKKIFDANTALRTQALTLPDGTVATDEEDFKTKAQAIYDNGKSAWETARALNDALVLKNRRLASDYTGIGRLGRDQMNNMTFNLRDEQKYAPTYDRVADYVSSPLDFDWSNVSNKDAYRMRRMVRKSRANGVDMTTPENFFVKRSNPSDTYSGEIAQYTAPEYTTTYDGKEITGLYKQGGQTNYLNLFN